MKKLNWLLPILLVLIVFYFISGYRFTALNAAESNSSLMEGSKLIDRFEQDAFTLFIFENEENQIYQTVLAEKKGIFYDSQISSYYPYYNDPIKLVGGMSVGTENIEFSFISAVSRDEEIAYIEAGIEPDIERKEVSVDERVYFYLDEMVQITSLNPVAYNEQGEALYYFGYPEGENNLKIEDFRWHEVEEGQDD